MNNEGFFFPFYLILLYWALIVEKITDAFHAINLGNVFFIPPFKGVFFFFLFGSSVVNV